MEWDYALYGACAWVGVLHMHHEPTVGYELTGSPGCEHTVGFNIPSLYGQRGYTMLHLGVTLDSYHTHK